MYPRLDPGRAMYGNKQLVSGSEGLQYKDKRALVGYKRFHSEWYNSKMVQSI